MVDVLTHPLLSSAVRGNARLGGQGRFEAAGAPPAACVNVSVPAEPKIKQDVLDDTAPVVVTFVPAHPYADTAVTQALLVREYVRCLSRTGYTAVVLCHANSRSRLSALLRKWSMPLPESVCKPQTQGLFFASSKSTLILMPHKSVRSLVVSSADAVVCADAQHLGRAEFEDIRGLAAAGGGQLHVVSSAVSLSHWLRDIPGAAYHRVGLFDLCPQKEVEEYARTLGVSSHEIPFLMNAEPPVALTRPPKSLRAIARDRLWIRTKKGDIDHFIITSVQQKYLAHKRLARLRARSKGMTSTLIIVVKSRRIGITTIEQGESYNLCVHRPESQCLTLAHTDKSTRSIFKIAKRFHRNDPQAPALDGVGNERSLVFRDLRSSFMIATAGGHAPARGETLDRVHGSEVAKWCKGNNEMIQDLWAGLQEACSHGEIVAESTPCGFNWFADTFLDAKDNKNDWYPIFLRWFDDPMNTVGAANVSEIADTLTDEEANLVKLYGLSHNQIMWRRLAVRRNRILFAQEYPEDPATCFLTSGTLFFDLPSLQRLAKQCIRPIVVKRGLKIWRAPQPGCSYVIGVDTSEGLDNSDYGCAYCINRETYEDVACIHGRYRPEELARLAASLGRSYNNALLAVERNNHGHSVLNSLRNAERYRNLFYYEQWDRSAGSKIKRLGMPTNVATRSIMLNGLAEWLESEGIVVNDLDFIQECFTFKLQPDGTFAADPGRNDDRVTSRMIANYAAKSRLGRGTQNLIVV